MAGKIVVIFDFDRTLIDDDSDRWVISGMCLTHLFNQLRPTLPWTSLMDRMVEELHSEGRTIEDIAECLKGVPLHQRTAAAIRSAHALGCDLKVVSDANQFYIETILKHHGLYDCFSEIITNPTTLDERGRLQIFPYNDLALPHGCNLCPPNMCKGLVIKRFQGSIAPYHETKYVYLGDGRGDFCPVLKLGKGDHVMPRKHFPLWELINSNPSLVEAEVHEWCNGDELEQILLEVIHTISSEDIKIDTGMDSNLVRVGSCRGIICLSSDPYRDHSYYGYRESFTYGLQESFTLWNPSTGEYRKIKCETLSTGKEISNGFPYSCCKIESGVFIDGTNAIQWIVSSDGKDMYNSVTALGLETDKFSLVPLPDSIVYKKGRMDLFWEVWVVAFFVCNRWKNYGHIVLSLWVMKDSWSK